LKNPELLSKSLYYQLADLFEITAIYSHNNRILFRARPYHDKDESLRQMRKRLAASGFEANTNEDTHGLLIAVQESPSKGLPKVHIILFLATLVTMFFSPVIWSWNLDYFKQQGRIMEQVEFTLALIAILLFHEFGHYLAGKRRGVLMSLPYFIPAPNIVGTFGAIIKSRSPFTNRRDLIEVGATGPIAGFVVSIIALSIGLYHSEIIPANIEGGITLGDSLLIKFLAWLIIGPIPEGHDFFLAPAAFAGWVGLLVTMINLLPLGQLDGGHIIYGLIGRKQRIISKFFVVLMMVLGFWWQGWWFFGLLIFLFGINHPPTLNDSIEISKNARIMGWAAILIFIICFIPVPFVF